MSVVHKVFQYWLAEMHCRSTYLLLMGGAAVLKPSLKAQDTCRGPSHHDSRAIKGFTQVIKFVVDDTVVMPMA
jgi:hypothetical protein